MCLHSECELLAKTWEVFYVGIGSAGVVGGDGQPDVLWMGKFVYLSFPIMCLEVYKNASLWVLFF